MKNLSTLSIQTALLLITCFTFAQPTAFYKGALVTSITQGPSSVIYTTKSSDDHHSHTDKIRGYIDPIIMEYGFTDRMGFGFSRGGENYNVNVNDFYNQNAPEEFKYMNAATKYTTLDFSYHPFVTKKIDVSIFSSIGYYKVSGSTSYVAFNNGKYTPTEFSYKGTGAIIRTGVRARAYFSKRFGVMAMIYGFNGYVQEKSHHSNISDATGKPSYSTMLMGRGFEFGLCFRVFKQKGLKEESSATDDKEEKESRVRWVWD